MTDTIFDNNSNSDVDTNRLPVVDSIFSDNEEERQTRNKSTVQNSIINESNVIKRNKTVNNINRLSFNESEHIDHETKLFRRLSSYSDQSDQQCKVSHDHNDFHLSDSMNDDLCLEKTGWLNIKHWLTIQNHENIQLKLKPHWKRFWIWLKDSHIHLYKNYSDIKPNFMINTIDCLCYPSPEYRHRQNVFSLTTNTGDVYYFQSSNQSEVDHWIYCIHLNGLSKININLLKLNLKQLENDIIDENRMLKLSQLKLKLSINKQTYLSILKQIEIKERKLEIFHIDLFRKKCYLCALNQNQNQNLPNSTDLLLQISTTTKIILDNLNAFTPCGFYAYIISRRVLDCSKSKSNDKIKFSSLTDVDQSIVQTVLFDSNPQRKIIISINKMTTVNELLKRVTDKLDLVMDDHFLYCHLTSGDGFKPNGHDILHNLMYTSIELHQKVTYQIILNNQLNASGIDIIQEYPLTIFIKNVRKRSEGERLGIMKGDEIIMINNINVKDLDSTTFNRYLNQIPITLTFRSSRLNEIIHTSHTIQSRKITFSTIKYTKEIDQLSSVFTKPNNESQLKTNIFNINNEQQSHNIFHSNNQQIQKIIFELIETETSYVQDLQYLIDQYIEPLRNNSTILPSDAVESLYNSVKIIHQLQTKFLDYLQSNLLTKNIIISIAETFIRLSNDFKLYSTYCIIHLQINRLLNLYQNNEQLKDFLIACNPYHQHSSSFQSYLIKPVQRILKYPLFLQQMFIYCTTEENDQILLKEKSKLKKAIKIMNKINGYINSMQQLYEDFGQSFENFVKNYQEKQNKIFELNLSDLYAYGEIKWINMYRFISKKNSQNLKIFCFIFQNGCLLLVREQLNKKNQSSLFNSQSNSNTSDCFLRFLPMEQLQVEVIHLTDTSHTYTWQLIQTDPTTHFQTYFHFANRDAEIFVKTINNCISQIQCENNEYICISNICDSLAISFDEEHILSSRSCHNLLPISSLRNEYSEKNRSRTNRQSQSPIWKRRTLSLRKRPFSMTHNKDII